MYSGTKRPRLIKHTKNDSQLLSSSAGLDDGTVSNPTLHFNNDSDTGIYRDTGNTLNVAAGGSKALTVSSTVLGTPATISFVADSNTGFNNSTADTIDVNCGGTTSTTFESSRIIVPAGSADTASLCFDTIGSQYSGFHLEPVSGTDVVVTVFGDDVATFNSLGVLETKKFYGEGGGGDPKYTFTGDTNTGMGTTAADTLGFYTGGTSRLSISNSVATVSHKIENAAGTGGAPSYSFTSDPDTGLFSSGTNSVALSAGGTARLTVTSSDTTVSHKILNADGTAGAPSYSFTGDPDSGFYSAGANSIGIGIGGSALGTITSSGITFGSGSAFGTYVESTHSANWTGPVTIATGTITLVRIGKMVFVTFPGVTGTWGSATYFSLDAALPSGFRPAAEIRCLGRAVNNSTGAVGLFVVKTDGLIDLYNGITATNFTAGVVGLSTCMISFPA